MWTSQFNYERANTIEEAIQLLSQNEDAKALAGGHSLLPAMKLRLAEPPTLIDIGRVPGINSVSANGSAIQIGALATHATIAGSDAVNANCPALATACGLVGDLQVRNFGTIGGNIAHADPASDPPAPLVAYDAMINVQGSGGSRSIAASDFFIDFFTTALEEGELITSIDIPSAGSKKSAYVKMAHPASRYAVVGVCAVLDMDGNTCKSAQIAIGGATVYAMRSSGAEAALTGTTLDDAALNAAADALRSEIADSLMDDVSFPADYRQTVAGVYLKRAVQAALS